MWRAALLLCLGCSPASAPPRAAEVSTEEVSCAGCHAVEVREWSDSMHHASFASADFQASFRAEPRAYCADCHAPRRALGPAGQAVGIGCLECHAGASAHARAPQRRAGTSSCAPCHDFPVPGQRAILQATAREHAESDYAEVACASCHMPTRAGHRDHRFAASRDPALLAAALRVIPRGYDGAKVQVELASQGVGHRFPTGDIFRRLTVTLSATDASGRIVCDRVVYLNRDWNEHTRSLRERDDESFAADSRLGREPLLLDAPCVATPTRLRVNVDYARGAAAHGESFTAFDELELIDVSFPLPP